VCYTFYYVDNFSLPVLAWTKPSESRTKPESRCLAGQDVSDPQTWNLYSYTSNSPLNRIDEDGRRWFYKCGDGGCDAQWVNPKALGVENY
jgi:hypothetical protein